MALLEDVSSADLTTTLVAWWGAVIATVVLLWDVYKWRHGGPKVTMQVRTGMAIYGDEEMKGKTLVVADVTNTGDRATTLINMTMTWYPSRWLWLLGKPKQQFFVKNPGRHAGFPHKLEVGDTWNGFIDQDEALGKLAQEGLLYCNLYCSSQKRPISRRVVIGK